MEYYVISPNVWNDGNFSQFLKDMYNNQMVLMGWGVDKPKGNQFANMKKGDRIIVAQRRDYIWHYYFMGIIKSNETYTYKNAQRKNLDTFIDLKTIKNDFLSTWSTAGSSQIPAIGRIKKDVNKEIIQIIDNLILEKMKMEYTNNFQELLENNKNLILHGAPGTGKTHLAKEIAAQMICGKSFEKIEKDSDEEKAFNEQTEFVQFHPSYDYSDFVEGIRPIEGENGEVGFERKDGIFKEFCEKALDNLINSKKSLEDVKAEITYKEKIDAFLSKSIANVDSFTTAKENNFFVTSFNDKHVNISYKNKEGTISGKVRIKYTDLLTLIKENREIERTEVKTLTGRAVERQEDSYSTALINEIIKEPELTIESKEEVNKEKKFIFIIDEINRGELSKIFGELFFSIDPGYRGPKGKVRTQYANMLKESNSFDDELKTTTYGHFYIPENVYIIGTMNDIDRSVESMDFAMRRRFIFEEVTAEESAENMNLSSEAKERMKRINDVIEKTEGLNDAYKIGGAYFLNVDDFDKLWRIKLSSLIKEYLRGIDDDGSKYQKIEDAYFNRNTNNSSLNDTDGNSPTVEQ